MCILCNVLNDPARPRDGSNASDQAYWAAEAFLTHFREAQQAMERATSDMLKVSRSSLLSPENKRRYDRTHKQMKRVMRQWNMIEHLRESPNL